MASILNFERPSFSDVDLATLRDAVSLFSHPARSACWNREIAHDGSEFIEFIEPNEWRILTLRRAVNGRYLAEDEHGGELGEHVTFKGLLDLLGVNSEESEGRR